MIHSGLLKKRPSHPLTLAILLIWLAYSANLATAQVNPPEAWSQAVSIADKITENSLHGHIQFLADDLLEGRGPGSKGDAIAQLYLETQHHRNG